MRIKSSYYYYYYCEPYIGAGVGRLWSIGDGGARAAGEGARAPPPPQQAPPPGGISPTRQRINEKIKYHIRGSIHPTDSSQTGRKNK
eukprot:264648-Pyramimonas_sp.AAC.2